MKSLLATGKANDPGGLHLSTATPGLPPVGKLQWLCWLGAVQEVAYSLPGCLQCSHPSPSFLRLGQRLTPSPSASPGSQLAQVASPWWLPWSFWFLRTLQHKTGNSWKGKVDGRVFLSWSPLTASAGGSPQKSGGSQQVTTVLLCLPPQPDALTKPPDSGVFQTRRLPETPCCFSSSFL